MHLDASHIPRCGKEGWCLCSPAPRAPNSRACLNLVSLALAGPLTVVLAEQGRMAAGVRVVLLLVGTAALATAQVPIHASLPQAGAKGIRRIEDATGKSQQSQTDGAPVNLRQYMDGYSDGYYMDGGYSDGYYMDGGYSGLSHRVSCCCVVLTLSCPSGGEPL